MLNNEKNTFKVLIYFSIFYFVTEMSVYFSFKNVFSCHLLAFTIFYH